MLLSIPSSTIELRRRMSQTQIYTILTEMLVYGLFPEVMVAPTPEDKKNVIVRLTTQQFIETARFVIPIPVTDYFRFLRVLASHTGEELDLEAIARETEVERLLVTGLLVALENEGLIFRLYGYPRDLDPACQGHFKIYFVDNGLRNTLLEDFRPTTERSDTRKLWENFVFSERMKKRLNQRIASQVFFWHSRDGHELDYIELVADEIAGYNFGFEIESLPSLKAFSEHFPGALFMTVTTKNFWGFVT